MVMEEMQRESDCHYIDYISILVACKLEAAFLNLFLTMLPNLCQQRYMMKFANI